MSILGKDEVKKMAIAGNIDRKHLQSPIKKIAPPADQRIVAAILELSRKVDQLDVSSDQSEIVAAINKMTGAISRLIEAVSNSKQIAPAQIYGATVERDSKGFIEGITFTYKE